MQKKTKVPVKHDTASTPRASELGPWTGFGGLRDEIERLFDAFEPRLWFDRSPLGAGAGRSEMVLRPSIDLTENDGAYAVTMELPGLDPEEIHVKISNGMLTISGEKSQEKEEEKNDYHLSERRWGSFHRAIRLPENTDEDKIEAQYAKGVLTISLPKSEAALASEKTIAVKAA